MRLWPISINAILNWVNILSDVHRQLRKLIGSNALIFIGFLFAFGVIASMYMRDVLPAKYFYDDNRMRGLFDSEYWLLFESGINTVAVYDLLGYSYSSSTFLVGLFGISVGYLSLHLVLIKSPLAKLDIPFALFFGMLFTFLVIFYGQLSKEVVLTIITTCCFLLATNSRGIIVGLLVLCVYAIFFRMYWFLVIGVTIINYIFLSKLVSMRKYILLLITLLLTMSFVVHQTQGIFLSDIRNNMNRVSIGSPDVVTIIFNLFPTSNIGSDVLNGLISTVRLKIPIELILLGNIKYLATIAFQLWLTSVVFLSVKKIFSSKKLKSPRYIFSLSIIIAYWLIQGFFEPDFGTALRHQFALLPFFVFLFCCRRA